MPKEYCDICKKETEWINDWFEKNGSTVGVEWCCECNRHIFSDGYDTHAGILKAEEFARQKHQNQKRRDGKTPYYAHLAQVVANLRKLGITGEEMHCAGWLHDTIEDTNTDFDDLREGFGKEVAEIVTSVTKDKRLPKRQRESEYIRQLRNAGWKAQIVKLCDIWANISDLQNGYSHEEATKQIENKLKYFDAIKKGLKNNKEKIPRLDEAILTINSILSQYNRKIDLPETGAGK